jgi:hypothetical protein
MMDLIAQIGAASETLKKAIDLSRKAEYVELRDVLLDLREQLQNIRDANLELREENRGLRERLETREALTFSENVWWKIDTDGKRLAGPYCPKCLGDRDKPIPMGYHVYGLGGTYQESRVHKCPVCNLTIDAESVPAHRK